MPVNGPGGLEIAPLRRRALASLIDAAVFLPPVVLGGGGGVWLYSRYLRRRVEGEGQEFDLAERLPFRRLAEPRWQLALWAVSAPIEIRLRNWRSPGARAMGIRRVDARIGSPVSVRTAVIRNAVTTASQQLNRQLRRPLDKHFAERRRAIQAELEEIRRTHADDDDAQRRATMEVPRRHKLRPWGSCGLALLGLVPIYLPVLLSARKQSLPDRVAGIIVVLDRDR